MPKQIYTLTLVQKKFAPDNFEKLDILNPNFTWIRPEIKLFLNFWDFNSKKYN